LFDTYKNVHDSTKILFFRYKQEFIKENEKKPILYGGLFANYGLTNISRLLPSKYNVENKKKIFHHLPKTISLRLCKIYIKELCFLDFY